MRYVVLFLLPFTAIFFQSTIVNAYSIQNALPDLVLIFVVFYALMNQAGKSAVYGFLCGLLEDLFLGRFIGMNALAKGITGFILGKLQGHVFKENLLVGITAVLLGTIINSLLLFLLSIVVFEVFNINLNLVTTILLQGLYNVLLSAPFYVWYYNSSRDGWLRANGER